MCKPEKAPTNTEPPTTGASNQNKLSSDLEDNIIRNIRQQFREETLLQNPKAGKVIRGTKGLRKIRIAFEGQGKSGSGRVAYVDFTVHEVVYLVTAYPKNEKDNLSKDERNKIAKMIVRLEHVLKEHRNTK